MYNLDIVGGRFSSLSPSDLIRSCVDTGEVEAWEEFVRRFQPLIAAVVARTVRSWGTFSPQTVDDLVQETFVKLCDDNCRLLRDFHERHPDSSFGYVKVIAANLAHDHLKSAHAQKRGPATPALEPTQKEGSLAPNESSTEAAEREILLEEVAACLARLTTSKRDQLVFWLYYRDGLTAKAISELPSIGLSTKGVESLLFRLTRAVRSELAATLKGRTDLPRKGIRTG